MTEREDLETRVNQFICMELPGQPRAMHMGTSYLVNDMWKEIQRLRTELQAARAAPAQPQIVDAGLTLAGFMEGAAPAQPAVDPVVEALSGEVWTKRNAHPR